MKTRLPRQPGYILHIEPFRPPHYRQEFLGFAASRCENLRLSAPSTNNSTALGEIRDLPIRVDPHRAHSFLKRLTIRTATGYRRLGPNDVVVIQDNFKDITSLLIALRRALSKNSPSVVVFGFCGRWPAGSTKPSRLNTLLTRIRSFGVDHYATYTPLGVEALNRAGIRSDKVTLLNNCGNSRALTQGFNAARASTPARPNSVVFVGRLLETKGAHLLPEIGRVLNKSGWQLEVVGDGPLRPAIAKAAKQGALAYYGSIHDDSELAKILARSSTLLTLGRVGLSVVDGLLLGLRVVSAGTSLAKQSPEVWYSRNLGIEVTSTNIDEIVSALTQGKEPDSENSAASRFSSETMAEKYLEAIFTAFSNRR